jgi:predicted lipid-binding transport protein (Tim44 family)
MTMDGSFDIYTIIFLVLAVVIFLRLRSVLGRRTGNERPPLDPYRQTETSTGPKGAQDKIVPMPRRNEPEAARTAVKEAPAAEERVRDFVPEGSPLRAGLLDVARADASFDPQHFVRGAKAAYEMIVTAFAAGDRKTLRPLLSKEVYDGFASAISEREERGESVETNFVGINRADVVDAEVKNRTAHVTVKFVSQLITAIRNRSGEVVEGDPKKVRELTDIWTFARETTSRDPNWKLVATQAAN